MGKAQDLTDDAARCVHLARSLNDQYPDPAKMPTEAKDQRRALLDEAQRLTELADIQKKEDDLSAWFAQPASEHPAVTAAMKSGEFDEALAAGNAQRQQKAFLQWMKNGSGGVEAEYKAALVEDTTGQIIVPPDIAGPIFTTLPHRSVFRGAGAFIRNTTSNRVDLRALTGATAGWNKLETGGTPIPDAGVAPQTTNTVSVWDLVAQSQVGIDELADTDADLPALIQYIVGEQFGMMEDDAFAFGTGTSQPWGVGARATSGLITQAVTAATTQTIISDELRKLPYQVPTRFRDNGAFFMSNDAVQATALLKDSQSRYLWEPSLQAGQPASLFGYRAYTLEGLPAMTAHTTAVDPSVIFGDPSLGYLIAQRQQVTMQRLDERYADSGLVGFIFRMRVGGDVMRPAAFAKYLL